MAIERPFRKADMEKARSPQYIAEKLDSRVALILAAERHFALHGIAGVPLKAIHQAAGQRNASATHYHFGSRDGLLDAIIEHRMPALNSRRIELLRSLPADGASTALRTLVLIWVQPLAEELRARRGGNHYLRFLDRLRRETSTRFAPRINDLQNGYLEVFRRIADHLRSLPAAVMMSRLGIAAEQIVSALARLEADLPARRASSDFPHLAIGNLIDYITGGLNADCTLETLAFTQSISSNVDFHFSFLQTAEFPSSA